MVIGRSKNKIVVVFANDTAPYIVLCRVLAFRNQGRHPGQPFESPSKLTACSAKVEMQASVGTSQSFTVLSSEADKIWVLVDGRNRTTCVGLRSVRERPSCQHLIDGHCDIPRSQNSLVVSPKCSQDCSARQVKELKDCTRRKYRFNAQSRFQSMTGRIPKPPPTDLNESRVITRGHDLAVLPDNRLQSHLLESRYRLFDHIAGRPVNLDSGSCGHGEIVRCGLREMN